MAMLLIVRVLLSSLLPPSYSLISRRDDAVETEYMVEWKKTGCMKLYAEDVLESHRSLPSVVAGDLVWGTSSSDACTHVSPRISDLLSRLCVPLVYLTRSV